MCPTEFLPASGTATLEGAPLVRSLHRVSLRRGSSNRLPWRRQGAATTVLAILTLIPLACGEPPTDVLEEPLPPEDLGTSLTSVQRSGVFSWWWPVLAWAHDGTEIFHFPSLLGPSGLQLLAVNTSDKSTRVVADIDHNHSGMLRLSADGEAVFHSAYSAYPPPTGGIYRVAPDGGVVEMLVDSVGTSFAISADGSFVAYATGTGADSLYLLNVVDRSTQAVGVEGRVGYVVGLSPDGKAVLHGHSPQNELRLTSLADGSTQTIWSEPGSEKSLLGLRWDEGVIQILFAQCSVRDVTIVCAWLAQSASLYIRDVTNGQDRLIATLQGSATWVAWSSDGALVAAWVPGRCVRGIDWFGRCAKLTAESPSALRQYTLHLIDARSGGATQQIGQGNFLVADVAGNDERPTDIVFSPDGSRIAYVYHQAKYPGPLLYVKELP